MFVLQPYPPHLQHLPAATTCRHNGFFLVFILALGQELHFAQQSFASYLIIASLQFQSMFSADTLAFCSSVACSESEQIKFGSLHEAQTEAHEQAYPQTGVLII